MARHGAARGERTVQVGRSGGRWTRAGVLLGPMGLAVLMLLPGSVAATPTVHTWSAPFHGHFAESGSRSTGHCLGASNDTTRQAPTFNATQGTVHLSMLANVTGATCGASPTFAKVLSTFTFTTDDFSVAAGAHNITVTWTVRYLAQLLVTGGTAGRGYPASAEFSLGGNGAALCDQSNGTCQAFPNSSARGGAGGWLVHSEATGSNVTAFKSATVTFYLTTTFTAHSKYRISTSLFAEVSAKARMSGHTARSILILDPVLGTSARLVGITLS